MATAKFILQGFTESTHGGALPWLFDLLDIQKILISVAYVSEGGVEQFEAHLAQHAACATVFAGVRNDTTSYQGLVRLHGVVHELYTVDTGSRTLIFHPKLYLMRGSGHARLMIGSANLTLAGLNNNIEAGMLLDFDLTEAADRAEVDEIERLFADSVFEYPSHVSKVAGVSDLEKLLAADRLVDESSNSQPEETENNNAASLIDREDADANDADEVPRIKLKTKILRSGIAKANFSSKVIHEIEVKPLVTDISVTDILVSPPAPEDDIRDEPESAAPDVFLNFRRRSRKWRGPEVEGETAERRGEGARQKVVFHG